MLITQVRIRTRVKSSRIKMLFCLARKRRTARTAETVQIPQAEEAIEFPRKSEITTCFMNELKSPAASPKYEAKIVKYISRKR